MKHQDQDTLSSMLFIIVFDNILIYLWKDFALYQLNDKHLAVVQRISMWLSFL